MLQTLNLAPVWVMQMIVTLLIDLVATYNIGWAGGNTLFSLATNINKTKVVRRTDRQSDPANPDPVYFLSDADVFRLENSDPDFRVNFTGRHSWANGVSATLRGNWYGDCKLVNPRNVSQVQDMSGDVYWNSLSLGTPAMR